MNCCKDPHHIQPHRHVYLNQLRYSSESWTLEQSQAWSHFVYLLYHFGITVIY